MEYTKTAPQAETLKQSPKVFRTLTGISPEKFDEIYKQLIPLYEKYEVKRLNRPNRQRAISVGGKYKLATEDKLLMLLMYYRLYVNHIFLGFVFHINDANVSRNINPLQPLLAGIFKIPEKRIQMNENEIMELIIDATEMRQSKKAKEEKAAVILAKREKTQ
ncbi:MAG: transposase family protein [Patescibacteria group bacterium]